jgi:4-hydroxy-4-methyl-2-oxoglutarate aldolase
MVTTQFRLSGDDGVGLFEPGDIRPASFSRVPEDLIRQLRGVRGLVSTASDVLDEAGWQLSVPSSQLSPRHDFAGNVIGHALTLRYLPSRHLVVYPGSGLEPPKLAHHVVYRLASRGDVMVIDASATSDTSTMGGIAAATAVTRGLSGVIVDGGVRDIEEITQSGLPLWSRYVTPRCGKGRLEAVSVNAPVTVGGVQVVAGDLVLADRTGVCFVPAEFAPQLAARLLEVTRNEDADLPASTPPPPA